MKKERKRFSPEEDKVIIDLVGKNPLNFQEAFRLAADKMPHSRETISIHWYTKLRYSNPVMMSIGRNVHLINGKRVPAKEGLTIKRHKLGFWTGVLAMTS